MKRFLIVWGVALLVDAGGLTFAFADTDGTLRLEKNIKQTITLKEAAAKALLNNPTLSAYSMEKRVREAKTLQSSLIPNPELEITVEDVAGSGAFGGFSQSETTIQLGQLIELGGKRGARTRANRVSEKLADWDYETRRLDVLTEVNMAFIHTLKAQHKVDLAEDLIILGEQFMTAVDERVKSGKVSPIERTKAKVVLSTFKIEREKSKLEFRQARRRLSSTWGSLKPEFKSVMGDLFKISTVPPPEPFLKKLSSTPYFERWNTEQEHKQANIDLALAQRIPDLKVRGGYKRLEETGDNAFMFGFSIPLPFYNRNQGGIAKARNELYKAREERRAEELKVTRAFVEAYQALVFAHEQVATIKSEILSAAQKAFDAVTEGYRFGKFGFLDVLDSQKTLFRTKEQYLDALETYHIALAEVTRITGGSGGGNNEK